VLTALFMGLGNLVGSFTCTVWGIFDEPECPEELM
jgi:cyclic lactone autoinducer peptide